MFETIHVPSDPNQEVVLQVEPLKKLIQALLVRKGMFAAEAELAADQLIEADLRGIHSHGSRAIGRYLDAIDIGDIDPRAQQIKISETAAMAVIDGSRSLGHVSAAKAMKLAIQKAGEVGTGTVAVRNSQHLGAASCYVLMAVREGMIGFCTTSTGPASVAAYGSRKAATANNAMSWGVPTRTAPPFVLDMACGATSWGRVETLKMYQQPLPEGVALDADGNDTNDPTKAKILEPAAGARGYGLAFMCSVLAGSLVGGKMPLHKTRSVTSEGSEHFFYAIDLSKFVEPDRFYDELESTIAQIREMPAREGFDKVRLPGEMEWERAEQWKEAGIPFHRDHVKKLEEIAAAMKVAVPWS